MIIESLPSVTVHLLSAEAVYPFRACRDGSSIMAEWAKFCDTPKVAPQRKVVPFREKG
jgi:hypothetical protein